MRITWSAELETGIRAIDRQHEELIGMLNELDDAHRAGHSHDLLNGVLQRLDSYIAFHFSTEETLLSGQPGSERHAGEHRLQHRTFIEQVAALRQSAGHDGRQAMRELVAYLNGWLYEHILKTDRQLGALLNGRAAALREQRRPA